MKINAKDTATILEVINAYWTILSHKAHRSADELKIFNDLTPLLNKLNECEIDDDSKE